MVVAGLLFCIVCGGPIGLLAAFEVAKAAHGRLGMQVAAASFGVAGILMYCEALSVLLKAHTGPLPVPMSRRRPLAWITITLVAVGVLAVVFALPR
jgi:hypothetical protein